MNKWADYLISEVNYDSEHLVSIVIWHQDTDKGITMVIPVDRLTISSDIKSGLLYSTIYHGINTWKKGKVIQTFFNWWYSIFTIDENKVILDYLGDLPNSSIIVEELPQELESPPEPKVEIQEEEVTPEQLSKIKELEKKLKNLKSLILNMK